MKYAGAFVMKWILNAVILLIVFSAIYGADVGNVLLMSVVFAAIAYLGDVFILPRVSNTAETIMDLVFSFVVLWILGSFMVSDLIPLVAASAISAVLLAVGEWFFHVYMKRRIFHQATT